MRLIKALARFVAVVYDGQVCDEQRLECRWDERRKRGAERMMRLRQICEGRNDQYVRA